MSYLLFEAVVPRARGLGVVAGVTRTVEQSLAQNLAWCGDGAGQSACICRCICVCFWQPFGLYLRRLLLTLAALLLRLLVAALSARHPTVFKGSASACIPLTHPFLLDFRLAFLLDELVHHKASRVLPLPDFEHVCLSTSAACVAAHLCLLLLLFSTQSFRFPEKRGLLQRLTLKSKNKIY